MRPLIGWWTPCGFGKHDAIEPLAGDPIMGLSAEFAFKTRWVRR